MPAILIVDDEKNIRTHLATYLREMGYTTTTAASAADALTAFRNGRFDLVVSDVRMPGIDGLSLLAEVKRVAPDTGVVLMTAYATVAQAVEAMRAGAQDYIVKPFALEEMRLVVERALEVQTLRRENRRLRRAVEEPVLVDAVSASMKAVLELARRAAESDVTVLLTGESGTGKSVLARQIHAWSGRRTQPFVAISCTTLAEQLLESELFGHVKGAFTGAWKDKPGRVEAAQGGTLFLDEVGELAPDLQAKLLRFIEERRFERVGGSRTVEVDARIVAATNRDLEAEVAAGRFRSDLYFRLNVVAIRLPPLRDRREDIAPLLEHLLETMSVRHARRVPELDPDARRALEAYAWPGNVRELVNIVERAIVLARSDVIRSEDLPDRLLAPASAPAAGSEAWSLDDLERRHIARVLTESATLEEAAARLGINVTTLWRKRKRYGIE